MKLEHIFPLVSDKAALKMSQDVSSSYTQLIFIVNCTQVSPSTRLVSRIFGRFNKSAVFSMTGTRVNISRFYRMCVNSTVHVCLKSVLGFLPARASF